MSCEWDPAGNRPAPHGPTHAEATLSVGTGTNNWHLCASCAALPRFKRLRRRVALKTTTPATAGTTGGTEA